MSAEQQFTKSSVARLLAIKALGDGALGQVSDEELFRRTDDAANSIAIIAQHLHGNMMSRWTDFLTTDGNKPWRKRDEEFEPVVDTRDEIVRLWEESWKLTIETINALKPEDVLREIRIRNEPLTAMDAIIRQIAHYSYHVGQMVTLARQMLGPRWQTLSVARGKSGEYKPRERAGGIKE